MPNLDKVSIFCFFASYVVALGLELTQFLKSSRINRWAAIGFTGAGLIAQTLYLVHRSQVSQMPPLIGSMHDWLLVLAWVAAAVYMVLELRDRRLGLGVFLLPLVLLLVSSSTSMKQEPRVRDAQYAVEMFHASLLVFGIAGVTVGFLLSLMYLVQHNRLRHKTPDPDSLQLYSLERLGRMNWWAVVGSVPLLTLGMLAGVCLAWKSKATATPVDLAAPGFVVMYVLWLAMIVLLGWLVARSQSSGKIVAWRTLWACGFLLVTMLCLEVFTGGIHGKKDRGTGTSARPVLSVRTIHHGGTEARRPEAVEYTSELNLTLGPQLRLGPHIPEAPLRTQARGLGQSGEGRRRWTTTISVSKIFRHAAKQSFADMRSQAELGTEGSSSSRDQALPDRIEHPSVPPCLRGELDVRANAPVPLIAKTSFPQPLTLHSQRPSEVRA